MPCSRIVRSHACLQFGKATAVAVWLASATAAAAESDIEPAVRARLEAQVTLADVLELALARSPGLAEVRSRVQAGLQQSRADGRWPDLQFKYEQWSVPLRRPWDLGSSMALMFGVQQVIPPALSARRQAAAAQAEAWSANERTRRLDLRAQVRRAYAQYYEASAQLNLHREHADLIAKLLELSRAGYQSGRRSQQDVLRLSLEVSRIHGTLVHMEPERRSAQALLNALMNRPLDAPLGPPAALQPPEADLEDVAVQGRDVEKNRPELAAAEAAVRRTQALLQAARGNARTPSFMVGLDYMYMPMDRHQHTYGAMLGVGLPWLNPGRGDEERAAAHQVVAEREALEAAKLAVRYEVANAQLQWESARASFEVLERDIIVQAQRNLDAARALYAAGQSDASSLVDAARIYLEIQVERVEALAHVETAAADLARARAEETTP